MSGRSVLSPVAWLGLAAAGLLPFMMPSSLSVNTASGQAPPDVINLRGVIHDFSSSHPDFNSGSTEMGHYVGLVGPTLGPDGVPAFTGMGQEVTSQWHDQDGNPIAPYPGPGLPFGHFDVDVYDAVSTTELYHEHEFDDTFDVTYVDIFNDPNLLFDAVVGSGYPNDLRLEFFNAHNGGGGTYTFEAGGGVVTGTSADGFTTTFTPALLTQLRVDFVSLLLMRATNPGNAQDDVLDRDDSFYIRMYDVITDVMVYEITVYYHDKGDPLPLAPVAASGVDSCGVAYTDTIGSYGSMGTGAITDTASFDQWFRDEMGTNLSTAHTIALTRDGGGVYEYLTGAFYPIDGLLLGNEGDAHNNYFTYAIAASFTYNSCTGQFFEFAGNDDAWVYIDNKLALDIGGTATPERQYASMDRLDLVDGQVYTLDFFYAHRRDAIGSVFNMRTNLVLEQPLLAMPTITAAFD